MIVGQRLMGRLTDSPYAQGCPCSITAQAAIFFLQRLVYCPPANKLRFCRSGAAEGNGCASRAHTTASEQSGARLSDRLFVAERTFSCGCAQALCERRRGVPDRQRS
ncbi:unnamed protein product [Sphagnum troendelagicum]|uniref:Uncharacterized protein n=1 Tax=Sphagnum troendelagicum TaxID=128251 RepID=A0ABP0TNI3_9BRYO